MICNNKIIGCYHDNSIHFEGSGKCLVKGCKCKKYQKSRWVGFNIQLKFCREQIHKMTIPRSQAIWWFSNHWIKNSNIENRSKNQ